MLWTLASTLILIAGLYLARRTHEKVIRRFWMIAPSSIFLIGLIIRLGIGGTLIAITPGDWVLSGEYGQYEITSRYIGKVSEIWSFYLLSVLGGYATLYGLWKKLGPWVIPKENRYAREEKLIWPMALSGGLFKSDSDLALRLRMVVKVILLFFLLESVTALISGASDRGAAYSRWVDENMSPLFIFKIFSRFKQVAYFLLPWVLNDRNKGRVGIAMIAIVVPLIGLYSGGRGEAMYPVVALMLGYVIKNGVSRDLSVKLAAVSLTIVMFVPWIGSYRDSREYGTSEMIDINERLMAFGQALVSPRFSYRIQALGREMYACSDAYLFMDENREKRFGYGDINRNTLVELLIPRVLNSSYEVIKNDGARIAQGLIGVNIKGWYPCMTTPGDGFRRGGLPGVMYIGVVFGAVIMLIDQIWIVLISRGMSSMTLLICALPVSYIQSNLHGTVRDLLWNFGWDMPKYVLLCFCVGVVIEVVARLVRGYR